jgi:hypothetical protein
MTNVALKPEMEMEVVDMMDHGGRSGKAVRDIARCTPSAIGGAMTGGSEHQLPKRR